MSRSDMEAICGKTTKTVMQKSSTGKGECVSQKELDAFTKRLKVAEDELLEKYKQEDTFVTKEMVWPLIFKMVAVGLLPILAIMILLYLSIRLLANKRNKEVIEISKSTRASINGLVNVLIKKGLLTEEAIEKTIKNSEKTEKK